MRQGQGRSSYTVQPLGPTSGQLFFSSPLMRSSGIGSLSCSQKGNTVYWAKNSWDPRPRRRLSRSTSYGVSTMFTSAQHTLKHPIPG